MNHTIRAIAVVSLAWLAAAAAHPLAAHAQAVCVTDNASNGACQAGGTNSPPVNGNLPGAAADPRWCGATEYAWTADTMEVRVARYASGIVLSLEVHDDTGPATSTGDAFFVGLWSGTSAAGSGTIIQLKRNPGSASATDQGWNVGWTGQQYHRTNNGAWTAYSNNPERVASWVKQGTLADVQVASAQATRWNMRVLVPFDSAGSFSNAAATGVPLPSNAEFRIWVEARANLAGGTVATPRFPSGAALLVDTPFTPPDPNTWQAMTVAGGTCLGGVDIDIAGINVNGGNVISGAQLNHFHATPRNNSAAAIGGDQIQARFRIANWGSSVNWVDVPVPGASQCKQASGSAGSSVASGAYFDLTCDWQLTSTQVCEYTGANCGAGESQKYGAHQCVLADLSSKSNATQPVYFSRASASRNVDFTPSSKIEEQAEIDLRGLPPIPGQSGRDVYLHVQAINMPGPKEVREPFSVPGREAVASMRKQVMAGALRSRDLTRKLPTYVVYAYYDTGKTHVIDGAPHKLLEAMPSFGYHIYHDGKITGFKHSALQGAALIAPDFYRLHVTDRAKVGVSIESLEAGPVPETTGSGGKAAAVTGSGGSGTDDGSQPQPRTPPRWWLWLVIAAILALLIFLGTRKPKS